MKHILVILILLPIIGYSQGIGIGTNTPDPSAILDIQSANKGILIPRMDSLTRSMIINPAPGLMVYDLTSQSFHCHNGSDWVDVSKIITFEDEDGDTNISLGINTNDDKIRFTSKGIEAIRIDAIGGSGRIGFPGILKNINLGNGSGNNSSTGVNNIFIGENSGASNTSGSFNVAVGTLNALSNTTGSFNTFIGDQSGYLNDVGNDNTFLGQKAGHTNKDKSFNTFLGSEAGKRYDGEGNIMIGYQSGLDGIGDKNIGIGSSALETTNGSSNVAIGDSALFSNMGTNNLAVGHISGIVNRYGAQNIFLGNQSGLANNNGANNVMLGFKAGEKNVDGGLNTYIGNTAGPKTDNSQNTMLGFAAGGNSEGSNNVFLGFAAGYNSIGSNKLHIANAITSSPLIYGEFDNGLLEINDRLKIDNANNSQNAVDSKVSGPTSIAFNGEATGTGSYGGYLKSTGSGGIGLHAEGSSLAANFVGDVATLGHMRISGPTNDSYLYMKPVNGNEGRVLVKQDNTDDVYIGDVDARGGDVYVRANGSNKVFIGQDGKMGLNTTSPTDVFHISAPAATNAMRVQVDGVTRFRIHGNGGVSIGANQVPHAEGLRIQNLDDGNDGDLRADGSGRLYKGTSPLKTKYISINPLCFDSEVHNGIEPNHTTVGIRQDLGWVACGLNLPDGAQLESVTLHYLDEVVANLDVKLRKTTLSIFGNPNILTTLVSTGMSNLGGSNTQTLSHVVDNSSGTYYISGRTVNGFPQDIAHIVSILIQYKE